MNIINQSGLLFALFGLLTVLGAYFDWSWYMNSWRANRMVELIGRGKARVFFGIVGLAIMIFGCLLALNVVKL